MSHGLDSESRTEKKLLQRGLRAPVLRQRVQYQKMEENSTKKKNEKENVFFEPRVQKQDLEKQRTTVKISRPKREAKNWLEETRTRPGHLVVVEPLSSTWSV